METEEQVKVEEDVKLETADIQPNQTIYINNLYEKISKKKLVEQLYALFSKYGQILEIVACKSHKMRGQAFIVFNDIISASNSLREMNGFKFLDKPMRIQYCKTKSDAVSKIDGTYSKRERDQDREEKKKSNKKQDRKPTRTTTGAPGSMAGAASLQPRDAPPNKNLFVENLPDRTDNLMLQMLFGQFEGFKEVHMVETKKGIAFVEFEDENRAGFAMTNLQHFKITPDKPMVISFAAQ
ncbi:hypothetical protein CYY_000938 [Polysphondylium violaceum]|uniref:RRM domain-containing protein n=1 Tax=Polysphondylium violaceum TaxID=133409 RepID=A0A8J4Q0W3_9MYCE|nr:hypothetical protein CYY_000938 [Polysphondylium violaceum]